MDKKITAIIQARVGSTRLPGKVLINIKGKTILNHVVDRVRQSTFIDDIVIATTTLQRDDLIVDEAKKINCKYFRGSESNVLDRYYQAATTNNSDIIIRITSDCPLIDPQIIDKMIQFYLKNDYGMVTNISQNNNDRTYPRGLDAEIFSYNLLELAVKNAKEDYQLEHVTPYIYENYNNIYYYKNDIDYSKYRLTLDTEDDLKLIKEIYDRCYIDSNNFYLKEIIEVMEHNPQLYFLNNMVEQKKLKD